MNIYVSNLTPNVQDDDLRDFFAAYGEITSAKIITDRATGESRGFGFVEMPDEAAAKKAIQELDQATVEGNVIRVVEARPKENKSSGKGNNFRNNSGGGGFRKNKW